MKKTLLLLLLVCFGGAFAHAQAPQFPEPEFIGQTLAVLVGDKTKPIAQEALAPRHRSSAGAKLFGIGRTHIEELVLNSPRAATRLQSGDGIALIIRVMDNQLDPMSEISIFRFKTTKKLRIAEYGSEGTFGDRRSNTLQYQPFTARRFGTSSYMVILQDPQPGEYGITVNMPGNSLTVSAFGIDK